MGKQKKKFPFVVHANKLKIARFNCYGRAQAYANWLNGLGGGSWWKVKGPKT